MTIRSAYSGTQRKLVLAFDVGTTFSGISYSILDPGVIPQIWGVTRYPAQEQVGADSKIPSVIYYDRQGKVKAVGAEAIREGVEELAEDEGWIKAEWFKLHLRPKTKSATHISEKIPLLPPGKSAIGVFADFLRYLHKCARTYIEETHPNGVDLWESLARQTEFVLSHPNGWEGGQQYLMRRAAIMAGLVPDTHGGRARLSFVTEGEASLHFCIRSGLTTEAMKSGKGLLIVDAGGGTIDISAYKKKPGTNHTYEEIAAPQCHFQGSIFVTKNAEAYLVDLLQGSKFVDDLHVMVERFDKTTKLRFVNPEEPQFIKFGGVRDQDLRLNIRHGQLKLPGTEVAKFFKPSINCVIKSIEDQCNSSATDICSVFLVGGFATSNWLFNNLKATFAPQGLDISRPDRNTNKAVADGAVSFYIDHFVTARVAKFSYGINANDVYDPSNPEHTVRKNKLYISLDGTTRVDGGFEVILRKDTAVHETEEFRQSFKELVQHQTSLRVLSAEIRSFRGVRKDPRWIDEGEDSYHSLCRIEADVSNHQAPLKYSPESDTFYYEVHFDIILSLGLTEFKASIAWKENGVEKRSPARMVYDPEMEIPDNSV
ncbi:unnamed protein product [Cyclocybe aegerita]|uniref:Heat shock 70 kDa protein 12A n=1 Tax=Cyclocybe aegerita TaxID=1973307 RepID=A0A8S0W2X4_CYCAE|nr:unnamed protein product [Cyclocybe aegerita]